MQREIHIIYDDEKQLELKEAIGYVSLMISIQQPGEIERHKNIVILDLTKGGNQA